MHISPDIQFSPDPHTIMEHADFSALEALYGGKKAYYGDYHSHSASGGFSDGRTTQEEWLEHMKRLEMDFTGLLDHRQVRHMYLPSFDPEYFLYGTEPGALWTDRNLPFHYLMIVPEPECLIRVMEAFPDVFEFTGGTEGTYKDTKTTEKRFREVVKAVEAEGGVVVHPHPKQVMQSDDPMDYCFGDHPVIETIYTCDVHSLLNIDTEQAYHLFMDMLDKGCKVINTASEDCHRIPANMALNTVYTSRKHGRAFFDCLRSGDLTAGFMGIKMCIGDTCVGGTAPYSPGSTLLLEVNDAHRQNFDPNDTYRLDLLSDQGLVWSGPITLPFRLAVKAEDRRFYRAVVIRESDNAPAAIGNPIWLA